MTAYNQNVVLINFCESRYFSTFATRTIILLKHLPFDSLACLIIHFALKIILIKQNCICFYVCYSCTVSSFFVCCSCTEKMSFLLTRQRRPLKRTMTWRLSIRNTKTRDSFLRQRKLAQCQFVIYLNLLGITQKKIKTYLRQVQLLQQSL